MENFSEVVVIGGGPSGSFTALNLAKRGIKVTVFEEHREIGVPFHCAGHISIRNLKLLGLYPLPENIVENIFWGAKIYSPNGKELTVKFNEPITCTVNRELFDKHIAHLAQKHGAIYYLGTRVKSLVRENGFVRGVKAQRENKTFRVLAKIVVDAEGFPPRMLTEAGIKYSGKRIFVNGIHAEAENIDAELDFVEVFLGKAYAPGFYAWLIPKLDGKAKIGLAVKKGNPEEFLKKLMYRHPVASKRLREARILKKAFHPITLGGVIPRAYSNGFLAVGDAASQVKPTTGGGIILGLNCAKIAADVIQKALNDDDFSAETLMDYQKRIKKLMKFDMKAMLMIRKMLDRMPDKKLDGFIRFCKKFQLENSVKEFSEIDFQGQAILKAIKNPRIFLAMAHFIVAACLPSKN